MPQPAFRVRPASCTLARMSSIESVMVPDTVQLIVLVAGLCSRAPALEVMRPAGMAPRRSAHRKRSYQYFCFSAVASASDRALATRFSLSSMAASTGSPRLVFRRYFLSQLSSEAGCISLSRAAFVLAASSRTVLMCPSALPGHHLPAGRPDLRLWVL